MLRVRHVSLIMPAGAGGGRRIGRDAVTPGSIRITW
jgi:hypothetical protein